MPGPPQWRPLDEIAAAVSAGDGEGRIIGIVASSGALAAGWAEGAALTLADAWSRAGRRVVLVDGALERPALHAVAGIDNGEGLSDAALYGASVARVARETDGGYFVIPAGTAVADGQEVVRSARWGQLTQSFVEAGVTLGLFVADGEKATQAFLDYASEIIVLAGSEEGVPSSIGDLAPLVSHVTGPGPAPSDRGSVPAAPSDPGSPPSESGELSAAALKRTAAAGKGRLRLLLLLVLVLVAVLAAMLGLIEIPGLTPSAAEGAPLHR